MEIQDILFLRIVERDQVHVEKTETVMGKMEVVVGKTGLEWKDHIETELLVEMLV